MSTSIEAIQRQLREEGMDGWLFYDHHAAIPAYAILGLPESLTATRRW